MDKELGSSQEIESLRSRVAELEAAASRNSSTEHEILRLNADLKRSFDDAPVGLCYFDTDLRYVHINEWLAKINGLPVQAPWERPSARCSPT